MSDNTSKSISVALSCDHAGFSFKAEILELLEQLGYTTVDFGTVSGDSVDYPDFVHPMAKAIDEGSLDLGVTVCGSGNGVAMTANKYSNVRAAICWNEELASLARQHNNANVIAIPARFISAQDAKSAIKTFLSTDFEGGRHERRVNKIAIADKCD